MYGIINCTSTISGQNANTVGYTYKDDIIHVIYITMCYVTINKYIYNERACVKISVSNTIGIRETKLTAIGGGCVSARGS